MPGPAPSGDAALTYSFGAGWLNSNDNLPAAFKSLSELLSFWEISAQSVTGIRGPFQVYSINSVSTHTALCVTWAGLWLLYMAPGQARNGWYYITTILNHAAFPGAGPMVAGLRLARYVAIKGQGSVPGDWWPLYCFPDMKNLTQL